MNLMLLLLLLLVPVMLMLGGPNCDAASSTSRIRSDIDAPSVSMSVSAPPYNGYADAGWSTFYDHMLSSDKKELRLAYDSKSPSNYWNAAVAFQSILHYANFSIFMNESGRAKEVAGIVADLVETQTRLNESDPQLRDRYNDDMSWMIHGLIALYEHTQNYTYINMSVLLLETIQQSDDNTCCGDMPGGLWWDLDHTSKATAAQAGATLATLRIMETGQNKRFNQSFLLSYAESHYQFWRQHMVNNQTGQVCDNINKRGTKSWWSFTYNNGLMLGCAVHLFAATKHIAYLYDAALFAGYLLDGEQVIVNGSTVTILANDCNGGCDNDSSQFHQVGFQYLTEYYRLLHQFQYQFEAEREFNSQDFVDSAIGEHLSIAVDRVLALTPITDLYTFLKNNIDSLWNNARNATSGTFNCNWDSPFSKGRDGLQGSMNTAVSALSLFAMLPAPTNSTHKSLISHY